MGGCSGLEKGRHGVRRRMVLAMEKLLSPSSVPRIQPKLGFILTILYNYFLNFSPIPQKLPAVMGLWRKVLGCCSWCVCVNVNKPHLRVKKGIRSPEWRFQEPNHALSALCHVQAASAPLQTDLGHLLAKEWGKMPT